FVIFFLLFSGHHLDLHSFPTRRSSDLPYFSIRRQNTFGTWRSAPMARCTLPQGIKDSFSPLPLTARANCFILATKPTFASSHSRSEEHTSELQSRFDLVCRLLLEKKKK